MALRRFFEEKHLDLNKSQTITLLPEVSDLPNRERGGRKGEWGGDVGNTVESYFVSRFGKSDTSGSSVIV